MQLQLLTSYLADAGLPHREFAPSLYYAIAIHPVYQSQRDDVTAKSATAQPNFFRRMALLLVRFTGVVMAILGVQGLVYTILLWGIG